MNIFRRSARLFGIALVLGTVLTSSSVVQGVAGSADYAVRADDKLRIKIFQYPELSGEYTVSTAGTIAIAPIGEMFVDGASTKDIAGMISNRFIGAGLSDKPGTTVDLVQSRPIYVMGDVQKPGEYPYRPGVTVLQAVSLAGGWLRFNDPGLMRLERESITIRGDMRGLLKRYYYLVAQRARLNAELQFKTEVAFPPDLMKKYDEDGGVAEIVDEERTLASNHVDSLKSRVESMQQTRALYETEIEAVSRQILASRTEFASVKKQLDTINGLLARGLTTEYRKADLERALAQIAIAEQGFQTLILRARESITQLDQRLFDVKADHNDKVNAELQRTRLALDDVEIKFETNRNLLVESQLTAPSLVNTADDETVGTRSLSVVRVRDGHAVTIDAPEHMELLPGDVLKVQRSAIPASLDGIRRIPAQDTITKASNRNN